MPARQLVDEAEDALVGAGRDLRRARGLELQPESAPLRSSTRGPARAPRGSSAQAQMRDSPAWKWKSMTSRSGRAVDGHDAVARPQAGPAPPASAGARAATTTPAAVGGASGAQLMVGRARARRLRAG